MADTPIVIKKLDQAMALAYRDDYIFPMGDKLLGEDDPRPFIGMRSQELLPKIRAFTFQMVDGPGLMHNRPIIGFPNHLPVILTTPNTITVNPNGPTGIGVGRLGNRALASDSKIWAVGALYNDVNGIDSYEHCSFGVLDFTQLYYAGFVYNSTTGELRTIASDNTTSGLTVTKHTFERAYVPGDKLFISFDNATKVATFGFMNSAGNGVETYQYTCPFNPDAFGASLVKQSSGMSPSVYAASLESDLGIYGMLASGFDAVEEDTPGGFPTEEGTKRGDIVEFTNSGTWNDVPFEAGQFAFIRSVPDKTLISFGATGTTADDVIVKVPSDYPNCKAVLDYYAPKMIGKTNKVYLMIEDSYTLSNTDTLTIADKYTWLFIRPENIDSVINTTANPFINGQFGGAIGGLFGKFKYTGPDTGTSNPPRFLKGSSWGIGQAYVLNGSDLAGVDVQDYPYGAFDVYLDLAQSPVVVMSDMYSNNNLADFASHVSPGNPKSSCSYTGRNVINLIYTNRSIRVSGQVSVDLMYGDQPLLNDLDYPARRLEVVSQNSDETTVYSGLYGPGTVSVSTPFQAGVAKLSLGYGENGYLCAPVNVAGGNFSRIGIFFSSNVVHYHADNYYSLIQVTGNFFDLGLGGNLQGYEMELGTKVAINSGNNIRIIDNCGLISDSSNMFGTPPADFAFDFEYGLYAMGSGWTGSRPIGPNTIDDDTGNFIQAPRLDNAQSVYGQLAGIENPVIGSVTGNIQYGDTYPVAFKRLQNRIKELEEAEDGKVNALPWDLTPITGNAGITVPQPTFHQLLISTDFPNYARLVAVDTVEVTSPGSTVYGGASFGVFPPTGIVSFYWIPKLTVPREGTSGTSTLHYLTIGDDSTPVGKRIYITVGGEEGGSSLQILQTGTDPTNVDILPGEGICFTFDIDNKRMYMRTNRVGLFGPYEQTYDPDLDVYNGVLVDVADLPVGLSIQCYGPAGTVASAKFSSADPMGSSTYPEAGATPLQGGAEVGLPYGIKAGMTAYATTAGEYAGITFSPELATGQCTGILVIDPAPLKFFPLGT